MPRLSYILAVDIGGTFTDAVLISLNDRWQIQGKVRSRPNNPALSVLDAVEVLAKEAGSTPREILQETVKFAHGTTLTTNVMVTWSGARVGLLTTQGFGDEIFIMQARGRVAGLGLAERRHYRKTDKPPAIVPRERVIEVRERIDHAGRVVIPLTEEEADRAIKELLEHDVDSVAISLLWSPVNPRHEQLLKERLQRWAPHLPVSVSHEIAPVLGEYPRTATAVVNAYVEPTVHAYLTNLEKGLRERGLSRPILVLQAGGGVAQVEETVPVNTIESGPAAGVVGAKAVAEQLGIDNVIAADVGGTTFDISLLVNRQWSLAPETVINQYSLQIPMIDIVSLGAGGGSIAWVDEGRLRIGPQSAGADPGPAAYGWGGTEPTVTDADVVLGYYGEDRLLAGQFPLRADLARQAIKEHIADKLFDGDVIRAAAGIRKIVTSQMGDLIRKTTIQRGIDPRRFVLMAYGGAGPLHAATFCKGLGINHIVVPPQATVFSAYGAALSDIQYTALRSLPRGTVDDNLLRVNEGFAEMEWEAREVLARQGIPEDKVRIVRWAEMRYDRQIHDIRVLLPASGALDADTIKQAFLKRYTELYSSRSVMAGTPIRILRVGLEAHGQTEKPEIVELPASTEPLSAARLSTRSVFWVETDSFEETTIYDGRLLKPGHQLVGPAIIELPGTTIAVPPAARVEIDGFNNTHIWLDAK